MSPMMNGYKVISLLVMLTLILTSCNRDSDRSLVESERASQEEQVVLDVWHLWITENDGNAIAFEKALKAYREANPTIEIRIDNSENEAYKTKIKTAISVNEAPDVFFSWGAGFAKPMVESGRVVAIADYLEEDQLKNLHMEAANNFLFEDKLYGLPFVSWVGILYCNEEMFDEAGVEIPDTREELEIAIEKFKEKNIVPIAVGAKDAWCASFFQNATTIRTAGVDLSEDAMNKNTSFDRVEFVDGAQWVLDLVTSGAFDPDCLSMTLDESKVAFLSGETPMIYQGSWLAAEIQNYQFSDIVDKVVVKNFPGLADGDYNNQFLGGAIDGFMMSENCEHKKEAADFIAFIAQFMAKESYLNGSGIPVWDIDVEGEEAGPLGEQIMELTASADGYIIAWDTFLTGDDVTKHLDLVQELFAQVITAKEFAKGMQELNNN